MKKCIIVKKYKLFIICFLFSLNAFSQSKEFYFNAPGNTCYFKYICFAQNEDYSSIKRPFVFILGKSGKTVDETFNHDSLRFLPQFYNYMFVYLPCREGGVKDKLQCINGLASLLTSNFEYGHENLFLFVYDSSITKEDIDYYNLNFTFKNVHLNKSDENIRNKTMADFKETVVSYETKAEAKEDDDKYATYYTEEDTTTDNTPIEKTQKTYFGKPTAYNYTLTGIVRDKSTGEALPFAAVLIKGTSIGASTNADGYFTVIKVPSDTSVLVIQSVGYDKTEIYLTPQLPKKNFNITIKQSATLLKTVTITSHKDEILVNKNDVSTIKMTPRKLDNLPNLGEKDVMRSLQLMPGVCASMESSSGLYVRGGTPDQNLVLYDGFTVYHVDHLYGFFSAFNSNALKDVQLYKGGFEAKFGGRLSSVTEITGKDGNQNKFNIGADLSLLSTNFFTEIPIGKKFSSIITFRRSYKGLIYNKIFEKFNKGTSTSSAVTQGNGPGNRQQNTQVTSYFYDLNGKFTYRPTDVDIISLSIFNGIDKLDNSSSTSASSFGSSNADFNMNSTDLTKYGNVGSSLKWSRKWNEKLYGNTIFSYSNFYSDRNRSQERTRTDSSDVSTTTKEGIFENNDLKDYSVKSDYQWDLTSFSQIQFGGFGTDFNIKYSYAQNDTSTVLDKQNQSKLMGGYLQSKIKLFKDKVQFLPGIRASYFESTNQIYYEPRASISVNLTNKLTAKCSTGKYYQFVNQVTREDIMSGNKDFWMLADGKSIPISSAVHYILGLSYESENYLYSTEAYYKKLSNLTEYSLRFNPSPMGVSYDENFFSGYGYSRGIEFLVQKKSGKFNGWMSYTLGQARNHFDIYSDSYYPANQDVTHEFKIVTMYKYKRWDFSATWIYATGRPYTAPSGAYTVTLLDGSTQDFFTVTAKNGLRLPDYHRCDISVNYKLLAGLKVNKKRREIGSIGFSIFNLYNRKNIWYKQFTIEDGEIIETNVNYIGFMPNITLTLKLR